MKAPSFRRLFSVVAIGLLVPAAALLRGADWPDWRGPARTGVSNETGLPSTWSPEGQNLAWKAPYGGRSGPVVFGDHLYLQNTSESGELEQERVMCFQADTGKLLWEHKYNVFTSDVPAHRIAWSSPVVDPATGNVFAISANGLLMSLNKDGKVLWERSFAEEFGMWTTHGGRMSTPIIDGDRVIVSGITFAWGQLAGGAHRFISVDKTTGQVLWVSSPEGRPTDTIYANPFVADVNGTRTFFSGGSDGAILALKISTGEKIWSWLVSKRGLNTAALMVGPDVIVSHSEENIISNEMGMLAAVPADTRGELADKDARWLVRNVQAGYASPVSDGERIYVPDNGGILLAFEAKTGKRLWEQNLGTIQKSSPVLADGKLYVGTENGKFYIIRPHPDKAEVLDSDQLDEAVIGSPAVARGRVYVVTMGSLYAIGPKGAPRTGTGNGRQDAVVGTSGSTGGTPQVPRAGSEQAGTSASILVTPTEVIIEPGKPLALTVRAFDEKGRAVANPGQATWALENLKGMIENGRFTPDTANVAQAGVVKATVGSLTAAARVRVIPPLPWTFDFEDGRETPPPQWVNATGKFAVRDLDGSKVLVKLAENDFAFAKRCRPFFGGTEYSNYTIQADVRAMERRRQRGDVGIVAQRYELVLFGNQHLDLQPWQPETKRTVHVPYSWDADTWYTMKLEVQALDGTKVRVRGKVWPKSQPEPQAWNIERVDPIGSLKGSPGIYADAPSRVGGGSELYYDNIKVYANAGR
jgi:outer membrane protein assembly factor BamB